MNLYKVDFSNISKNKWTKYSEVYLKFLSKICLQEFNEKTNSTKKEDLNVISKLNIIENYINNIYNINISIYTIFKKIFDNLKFDSKTDYIYLKEDIKFENIKLITLIKIILFGTRNTPKMNYLLNEYLDSGMSILNAMFM